MHRNTAKSVKAIVNPGRRFTTPVVPEWTIEVADRLVAEFAHLGPALHAAAVREERARAARSTIETVNDGPMCLGWHYKAAPGTAQSLLRTGWHAVGEPCSREESAAILREVENASHGCAEAARPIWAAASAAALGDVHERGGQVTRGDVVRRVQDLGASP